MMRLKNSLNAVGENDQEDEQQEQAEEVMSKKVVEKLASSKKAKQVAVESELIHVDNDAPVSADEEEAETLIYVSSTVSPTTTVERKVPIFKAWSTKLLKKRESEELKSGGFGKLPILEYLEFIEPKKPKLKKKESKVLLLGSMSREQELEEFKTKAAKVKLQFNICTAAYLF
ncbi:hypothetical protein Tco_0763566 [Tanacetum coccineum]